MTRWTALGAAAALTLACPVRAATGEEISASGPQGALHGTLIPPARDKPLLLIVPGSGPTDRDGNNPMGIRAAPYRLLAEALAERGIGTARIDKRGLFASKDAIPDPNRVTVADYVDDVLAWTKAMRARTGARCIWLAGHSEGGLIALAAADRQAEGHCGLVLISAAGRPFGAVIREQLRANPANAPVLPAAMAALDRLERGEHVDAATLPPALLGLFGPHIQDYLIDLFAQDPAALAARIRLPTLIAQGDRDIQIGIADAEALHAALPGARLVVLPGMNHVLKAVPGDDPAANLAAYTDPDRPVDPALTDAIAGFVTRAGQGKESD